MVKGTLLLLQRDLGLVPITYIRQLTITCNFSSRGANALLFSFPLLFFSLVQVAIAVFMITMAMLDPEGTLSIF